MSKRTRRTVEVVVLVLAVLMMASGRLPSYSLVVISGPNGTTRVEHSGPGPHKVRVKGPDGAVAESVTW
jgi:hypothetical protein